MNAHVGQPFKAPRILDKGTWPPDYVSVYGWRQRKLIQLRSSKDLMLGALTYYGKPENAAEFICHWVDTYDPRVVSNGRTARMPMVLFRRQADLVDFVLSMVRGAESGLIEKCRDMGATWVCAAISVWLWRFWPGAAVGWGSRKADLVDKIGDPDSIFEKIRMIIRNLPPEFWPNGFDFKNHSHYMRLINPDNGSTITGESGDDIGRGGRKLIYFKDESAHYERPELIEAALGDNTRTQIDISSVNGPGNVFHRKRESGVEWNGEVVKGKTHVFVMDWRDHPEKDDEWYERRKAKHEDEGLMHIFAQEVDRDYSSAVTGTIIKLKWVRAALDAHIKLKFKPSNRVIAGLDVADDTEAGDRNALVQRRGVVLFYADQWGGVDTGISTRRTVEAVKPGTEVHYDCIGVGAGVKAEAARLEFEEQLPKGVRFVAWSASASPLNPDEKLFDDEDDTSMTNDDFYGNLKAQGWWELRQRFEKTYRMLTEEGVRYPEDELISISSAIPKEIRYQLEKELIQVVRKQRTGSMKMIIDKNPPGTRSPNLADATMMAFHPVPTDEYTLDNL